MTLFKLMTEAGRVAHEVEAATRDEAARLFGIHLQLRSQSQPKFDVLPAEGGCLVPEPLGMEETYEVYRARGEWHTTLGTFHLKAPGEPRRRR